MLHRKRGEGEHRSHHQRKWTRLFALSIVCAFFIVAFIFSDSAAYGLGQQPKSPAQEQSQANQQSAQQAGLSVQGRSLFAYDKSTTELEKLQADYEEAVQSEEVKRVLYQQAQQAQLSAQNYYLLVLSQYNDPQTYILDPTWERPLIEVQNPYEVPYTVLVPYTEIVETTTLVPRTTTTTHQGTLTASVYNYLGYNSSPPFPDQINAQPFYVTQSPNIDYNWGGGQILNSGRYEDVLVKFEGNIVIPTTDTYTFFMSADDGNTLTINNQELIYGWWDKGGGGPISEPTQFQAGVYPFLSYFYENGGGAAVTLYYLTPATPYWQVVPATWFGEYTVTNTVYDEVITYEEVTNYVEETRYRTEYEIIYVPDVNAVHPTIPDPELYAATEHLQEQLLSATKNLEVAISNLHNAELVTAEKLALLNKKEEELANVQPEPVPEPTPTPNPEPTPVPVPEPTQETETEPEPVLNLEAIPVLGQALSALSDVGEALSNIGSDMSPETRETAEKVVVSAIVVTQVATQAAQIATQAAQSAQAAAASASASSGSGSSSSGRRK